MPSSSRRGESASEPRQTCANPETSLCTEPRPSSSTDAASPATSTSSTTLGWISFYNLERLHEELGGIPPAEYEQLHREKGEDPEERRSGPPSCETEISVETKPVGQITVSIKPGCGSAPAARGLSSVQFSSGRGPTNSTPYSSQAFSICDPSTDSSGGRPPDREGRVMAR